MPWIYYSDYMQVQIGIIMSIGNPVPKTKALWSRHTMGFFFFVLKEISIWVCYVYWNS